MQVLEKLKIKKIDKKEVSFGVLILDCPKSKNSYNSQILGRTLFDWVAFACKGLEIKNVEWDGKENILELSKNNIISKTTYTIILLSNTPLISGDTINSIIDYCSIKKVNLCKLPVGYVTRNEYLIKNTSYSVDSVYSQNTQDFYLVETKKQFTEAEDILQERINTFHVRNGVEIRKSKSVYIEPDVDISSNVTIFSGNTLKGKTIIGSGVILKENNIIENSIIGNDCCISASHIERSKIHDNVYISAFSEIINCEIGKETMVSSGCKIYNRKTKDKAKFSANSVIGENDDSNCGAR